jgi:hypothetical protein
MAVISMWCTNPNCKQALHFDASLVNTMQHCSHCGQAVIVPNVATVPAAPNHQRVTVGQAVAPGVRVPIQERSAESTRSRRLSMGSGCFAMLAVVFAMTIVAAGLSFIPGANYQKIWAICALIAGLGGLIAFVFFGYIATETASTHRGRDHQ